MTKKLEWKDSYICNDPIINKQHKLFIERINHLYDLLVEDVSINILKNELQLLLFEAAFHFDTEEKYLRLKGYDHVDEHAEEHKSLMKTLHDLINDFNDSPQIIKISISIDIKLLLQSHFEKEDERYRQELK